MQAGGASLLGLGWPAFLGRRTPATELSAAPQPKQVLIVFLTGACSHLDTFDLKPDAPAEIRGEFRSIDTRIPGYSVCEHLPHLADRADRYAVIRSLSHGDNNHLMSTHHVLTGEKQPGGFFDKVASRDDWPDYAGALAYLRPRSDGLPCGVNLPTFLREGPLTWPGQHAGLLGPNYDPWQITGDANAADFKVDALSLADGVSTGRLAQRRQLLTQIAEQTQFTDVPRTQRLASDQQLAFDMLTSSRLAEAFDLTREPDAVRERYGRNEYGQSLLLARRLNAAGIPIVQVNMGRVQNWDHHSAVFTTLKDRLLPPLDRGVSALLDDLAESGRLAETLVVMLGEFGRTPKVNKDAGRDHWGPCFFGLFAGAGVQPGQVIGSSDAEGAYPATRAYTPNDVAATIYHLLGIDPEVLVRDRLGRPIRLNTGTVIDPLFTGREAS